jgi:hypothetical protein
MSAKRTEPSFKTSDRRDLPVACGDWRCDEMFSIEIRQFARPVGPSGQNHFDCWSLEKYFKLSMARAGQIADGRGSGGPPA